MSRLRNWCFTWFDDGLSVPGTWAVEKIVPDLCKVEDVPFIRFAVWQIEKCPETGRHHCQGYIELTKSYRLSAIKEMLPDGCHLEKRRGSAMQARDYCEKAETRVSGPFHYPCRDAFGGEQGNRTDLEAIGELIREGTLISTIANEFPGQYIRYTRGIKEMYLVQAQQRHNTPPIVVICSGEPGSGKSRWAYAHTTGMGRDTFWKPPGPWYDGYRGQDYVVFDEFEPRDTSYREFLRIMDRYPMLVPVKGSFIEWNPKYIIFTSSITVENWYPEQSYPEIHRRLTMILRFPEDYDQWDLDDIVRE